MDYSKTLHLPETDFPMRGNLPKREPGFVKMWKDMDLYHQRLEKRRRDGAPAFGVPGFCGSAVYAGSACAGTL